MRLFAAGLSTETNTFCPVPTGLEDFQVLRGREVLEGRIDYPSLDLSTIWWRLAQAHGAQFVFSLNAWAQPLGVTTRSAYESLRDEILRDLQLALPVDVVLLMLHGAMVAQGYEDCERDLIERIRYIAGPECTIGVELDLHCHLNEEKIAAADVVVLYKEYPHVDVQERARDLFRLAIDAKRGVIRPTMALADCSMVGFYPTSREPLRTLIDRMIEAEGQERVLSLSFGHGFQFADLPHVGAKMLAVTDNDPALARQLAEQFAWEVRALRHLIGFDSVSLPMERALVQALSHPRGPVVVADQSDNVGSGAPGDSTFVLRWLLAQGVENVALAIFYDPEVVKIAKKAGAGSTLSVRLGGKTGPKSGDPLDLQVTVTALIENYFHVWPQFSGDPITYPVGDVAALRCGAIDIVVGSLRCQCYSPSIFADLGIDCATKKLLIPKSNQHFQAAFAPIAADIIYMAAPGAAPPDPRQIAYRRLDTSRLYPWND